jgi:hypothetical protein
VAWLRDGVSDGGHGGDVMKTDGWSGWGVEHVIRHSVRDVMRLNISFGLSGTHPSTGRGLAVFPTGNTVARSADGRELAWSRLLSFLRSGNVPSVPKGPRPLQWAEEIVEEIDRKWPARQ